MQNMSHISHVSRASHVSMGSRRPTLVQNTQDLDMEEPLSLLSIRLLRHIETLRQSALPLPISL